MEELDQHISSDIYLAVRTPGQLRGILRNRNPLSSTEADNGTLQSRLSLFNDGMLGSVYDLGTYDDTPLQSDSRLEEEGTRSEELLFQYKLCQYVPNGGEVTVDNEYNDLDNAITDLSQMHVSYLNSEHDAAVLNKWKNFHLYRTRNRYFFRMYRIRLYQYSPWLSLCYERVLC